MSHCDLPEWWTPLEKAYYQTVHEYRDPKTDKKGPNALATKLQGKSGGALGNEADPRVTTHKAGLQDSIPVQLITKDFRTLHAYNNALGHVAIPLPDFTPASDIELLTALTDWQSRSGQTQQQIHDALDPDGPNGRDITLGEARMIRDKFYAQVSAGLSFLSRIDALAEAAADDD